MNYKLSEIFYSIQGEGRWSGKPCHFIRFSGCNLQCTFCDTDHTNKLTLNEFGIVSDMITQSVQCKTVVLTGGEPTLQDLNPLVDLLHMFDYSVHIETNGITDPYLIFAKCDWITVSPKGPEAHWDETDLVNEVKFLMGFPNDEKLIEVYSGLPIPMYVQPIDNKEENIRRCIKFCTDHPNYSLSLQLHKLIGVR